MNSDWLFNQMLRLFNTKYLFYTADFFLCNIKIKYSNKVSFINSNISINSNNLNNNNNIREFSSKFQPIPINETQKLYIDTLKKTIPSLVFCTGPAGSAKSFLAVSVGINELKEKKYKRLIVTRPTVAVEEDLGFLPGNITNKMEPWLRPLYDTFYKYYSVNEVNTMIKNKVIDICPIAYLRGRTLENSYIIIDEAQNCTVNQMLMILTRIGKESKMVLTGDLQQHDRIGNGKNGLEDFLSRMKNYSNNNNSSFLDIEHIIFTEDHVVRHPVIKDILKIYK
jgi:phosphate starvation-inducible PhoH-like protein